MKRLFSILSIIGLIVVMFTPISTIAQTRTQGSTFIISENSECASGYMIRCSGSGTLCDLTNGWKCGIIMR